MGQIGYFPTMRVVRACDDGSPVLSQRRAGVRVRLMLFLDERGLTLDIYQQLGIAT
jgi:hypothetical protein